MDERSDAMTNEPTNAFSEAAQALATVKKLVLDGERIQTALKENHRNFAQTIAREEEVIRKAETVLLETGNRVDALRSEMITLRSEMGTTRTDLEAHLQEMGADLEEGLTSFEARSLRQFRVLLLVVVVLGAAIGFLVFDSFR
jgi:predicted RNase H-like nuclease (RuvC/YqgF family)